MLRLNPGALAVALFTTTAAVAYARTGTIQQPLEALPTNTALVLALFSFLGGAFESIITKTPVALILGHIFGAVYALSYARLSAGQPSGAEIGLYGSFALAVIALADTGLDLAPRELGYVGAYGVTVFGNAHGGVGLAGTLLFALLLLGFRGEIKQIRNRVNERLAELERR
ncbi:uncharacterized protein N7483_009188 [Penicillium malachiteum]|uniref:uncharacterized protein n=1 Tax=Penicillium malachiteum TaxID=1324776 RepID=UPI00254888AF|nr:uncharacterized protein N7483_009188 [Penicillium malachiteum]KAJ5721254.1 hypothetical protein N7483_009188 [Penicillium malachiteum]